ncbi:uncharacterized protein GGS22DRAFT_40014 [Annulohypoxylon maeteangense]|uniref:uncharacterized protein n=1 Tax=Annulohypoxylon maeteangense TaxID=1927788 RepID=UPI0020077CF9|nr:uncharacterized protein GGS22DRAFT_40014 [Annulohypoxylon maeteangense]KAI0882746.1 hypothetical protein GGS22DRAFT_40014 [Annulohypoxylon maeteangense]
MKITTIQAALGSAILLLNAQSCAATTGHRHHHLHLEKKHNHIHSHGHGSAHSNVTNPKYSVRDNSQLSSRDGKKTCKFPSDKGLVAVTPSGQNGGWAMAPDQKCVSGTWCPFACPSGQVMAQWKPGTTYAYPESTYGGIYCNDDGEIEVPFKDKDWCVDGTGAVTAVNKAGKVVSFCQTCLPGYEDMIIPNDVTGTITLAVPGTSYWDETAAHYYINAPGIDANQGCHWGDESKPIGNWSPFVAGANTVADGSTYVKLGINPVWQSSSLSGTKPTFGLKVECPEGGCNGSKCRVDGTGVTSDNKASGAGGGDFCVVTVPSGGKANIVVYNLDGSGGDSSSSSSSLIAPPTSLTQAPTSISVSSLTSIPSVTSISSTPSLSTPILTSSSAHSTSSNLATTAYSLSSRQTSPTPTPNYGGVFQENGTSTLSFSSSNPSSTSLAGSSSSSTSGEESASSETNKNEGAGQRQGGAAMAGLVVAFVAATYLL